MIVPGSANPLLLSPRAVDPLDVYAIGHGVRLRPTASAYFSRTSGASVTSTQIGTFSFWVKRSNLGTSQELFGAGSSGYDQIRFEASTDKLRIALNANADCDISTDAVFRDTAAHCHILIVIDVTQGTPANRIKIYRNNVLLSVTTINPIAANAPKLLAASTAKTIAKYAGGSSNYLDGYLSEIYFIDGQALTPSSFGQVNSTTGQWRPKAYTGTYGNQGYYLKFNDGSSTGNLTLDRSGNGNNWTANNISVTAGTTLDWLVDTPTNDFCLLSSINKGSNGTIADGASNINSSFGWVTTIGTIPLPRTGKWWWEFKYVSNAYSNAMGVCTDQASLTNHVGGDAYGWGFLYSGNKYTGGTPTAYGVTWTNGDVIRAEFDAGAGTISFFNNSTSLGVAFSGLTGQQFYIAISTGAAVGNGNIPCNFGQQAAAYTPTSGFLPLNAKNLTIYPAITVSKKYIDSNLRTGTGANFSVSGKQLQPDLVWTKSRSAAENNVLTDSVRGSNKMINSNLTTSQTSTAQGLTSFNVDGFSGGSGSDAPINTAAATYVDWLFKKGPLAGFDVVTFTGNATNRTISHSLGVAPKLIVVKNLSSSANWAVWHSSLAGTEYLKLNLDDAKATDSTVWNSATPTTSVFSVGSSSLTNGSGNSLVAYLFAEVEGFSRFTYYTGNNSTDGPFIECPFQPAFVLIKRIDTSDDWRIRDTKRNPYNAADADLKPNQSQVEATGAAQYIDIVSNGAKIRTTDAAYNASGGTYLVAMWAEFPFRYANAR